MPLQKVIPSRSPALAGMPIGASLTTDQRQHQGRSPGLAGMPIGGAIAQFQIVVPVAVLL